MATQEGPSPRRTVVLILVAGFVAAAVIISMALLVSTRGQDRAAGPPDAATPSALPSTTSAPGSDSSGPDQTSASQTPDGQEPPSLAEGDLQLFLLACQQHLDDWRAGQVAYPRHLHVPLGEAATYQASIDIRPGAQDQPAPSADINVAAVQVQCAIGARLVALTGDVTIDGDPGWVLRQFDQPGTVEWSWTVRAADLDDTQVRLEIRPAIAAISGGYVLPATEDSRSPSVAYTSAVRVDAGGLAHLYDWWDTNWLKITGIAAAIGAAIGAVITWVRTQRRALVGEGEVPVVAAPHAPARPRNPPGRKRRRRGR